MTGALLEEGLRGAGGQLRNGRGERFMERYDPARLERSTRDLVSRASFLEVAEGRGTPNGGVWIDVSHLGAEVVERSFRGMVRRCRDFGRDLAREPGRGRAHRALHDGRRGRSTRRCRTVIEGLFAAGEDAGRRARRQSARRQRRGRVDGVRRHRGRRHGGVWWPGAARPGRHEPDAEVAQARSAPRSAGLDGENLYGLQRALRDTMWDQAGLVRDAPGLRAALAEIERIAAALGGVGRRTAGAPSTRPGRTG